MVAQQQHSANADSNERPLLRLGTRGSPLALAQAAEVAERLVASDAALAGRIETIVVKTSGDRITDRPLAEVGGKGLFATEIQDMLRDGALDFAVHSAKDLETRLPSGLTIASVLPRGDPRDVLLCARANSIDELPLGALLGTASMRRGAQLLHRRPDLKIVTLRGNVDTRLRKLREGAVDATVLALAGLRRLDRDEPTASVIDVTEMLPAVGQGTIAIECREDAADIKTLLARIDDPATAVCLTAERSMLAALDGSCQTPIGGLAQTDGDLLSLEGLVATPDGKVVHRLTHEAQRADAVALGTGVGTALHELAPPELFAAW